MPTRKRKHLGRPLKPSQMYDVAQKGHEWFEKHSEHMQQLPQGTLVLVQVETGIFTTVPPSWNDVELLQAQLPNEGKGGYWMFRITEGAHGKKEAGGVYSVGSIQAVA